MNDNKNKNDYYQIYEDKANSEKINTNLDMDIQIAYLNILHEQGVLPDKVHSIAIAKTMKGEIS